MVVGAIIDGIIRHRFVPGQRIVESDLARSLNVSRGTVREALKRLAAESMVSIVPHKGACIRALSRREVQDLLVCLETMNGLAARLAAENIDKGDNRRHFETAVDTLFQPCDPDDLYRNYHVRKGFYQSILLIGGNSELPRMMHFMQILQLRTQFHSYLGPSEGKKRLSEYREVADAILAGDARRAERAMKRHLRRSRQRLMKLPDTAFAAESAS